ncbi:nitrate- and nitrite sensing domain-containing protein [Streptomyces sp. DSM 44915]|uniref:histidine kinase n=1 Tax=Streptomyces chisholmiae TaxID=3075540 RepID=A0ABU2JLN9_9ACTN|nr:nitrate- and nitrite sensing domain-containing protein [Streptomyces sp. DSM 44915]
MRKTTSRDEGGSAPSTPQGASGAAAADPGSRAARRRRGRVRTRLLVALLLSGAAVLIAGAPAALHQYEALTDSQQLLDDSSLGERSVSLAHILADERDALVVAAAGEPGALAAALTDDATARADRRIAELRDAVEPALSDELATLAAEREQALAGERTPVEIHQSYTAVIERLDGLLRSVSRVAPVDAVSPTSDALPDLARAVHASSATRGLLLAALEGDGEQAELTGLAQREAVSEAAALADFLAIADQHGQDSYRHTVAGGDAEAAEDYLAVLTDGSVLDAADRALDPAAVDEALQARTGLQRGVLATLATEHTEAVEALRDDEMTRLLVTAGVIIGALLLALAVSVQTSRSLTRPLAAVRLGTRRVAADPVHQEPVRYVGRNDEFAEVVASVNALRSRAEDLQRQAAEAEQSSGGLRAERDRLLAEQRELTARLAALHGAVHGMFAHHAQRLLDLVEEQLAVIEGLEEHETDPDQLAVLFSVDHLAARMRRHSENVLLLAGAEPVRALASPMPLIDVARAAVSEIERYDLVETVPPPPMRIAAHAARDVSHLLAELLDNAAVSAPTGTRVRLTGHWQAEELLLTVEDEGRGLAEGRLAELNARLADPVTPPPGADGGNGQHIGMGLYTVARLAARHGLRCRLVARPAGGTLAEVLVPAGLLQPGGAEPGGFPTDALAGPASGGYPTVQADHGGAHAAPAGTTGQHPLASTTGQYPLDATTGQHPLDASTGQYPLASTTGQHPIASSTGQHPVAPATGQHPVVPGQAGYPAAPAPGGYPAGAGTPPAGGSPTGALPVRDLRSRGAEHAHAPDSAPVTTNSGLPLRTRVASAGPSGADTGRNRTVDPEELRRRLGGFQRGAREGHRDAALATGEFPAHPGAPADQGPGQGLGRGPGEGPGERPGRHGEEQPS